MARQTTRKRKRPTLLQQAQDVMYMAWEAAIPAERIALASHALTLSLDCADAYVLLAEEAAPTPEERFAFYLLGEKAGERAIGGPAVLERHQGHFWGILETRPYMRARFGLALARWKLHGPESAIEDLRVLLRLNPHDNQGVRYPLATALLLTGGERELETLLASYDDVTAHWAWTTALLAFRQSGASATARKKLARAQESNPFVADYLLGRKKLPATLPDSFILGQESEAVCHAAEAVTTWTSTPGALAWLEDAPLPARQRFPH